MKMDCASEADFEVEHRLDLHRQDGSRATLLYRPQTSELRWAETGQRVDLSPIGFKYDTDRPRRWTPAKAISPKNPGTKGYAVRVLKIQMGLKCNYQCSYCNQTSRPESSHGNPELARQFLESLDNWFRPISADGDGVTIEFWGGEPLVYWKTMKLLAESFRARYPKAVFNMVTNGSALDDDKIEWLDRMAFSVAISHDGPAHRINRGSDPFDDPRSAAAIGTLYRKLHPQGLVNFNCVLARNNRSLADIRRYIADKLGCSPDEVRLSTEEVVLPYEQNGHRLTLQSDAEHEALFEELYRDIVDAGAVQVLNVREKLNDFFESLASGRPAFSLGQRCAMDRDDALAVDLKGNVLTCQNTPADEVNKIGHVADYDAIRLDTANHWSVRQACQNCLVLQLCKGSCMRLEGQFWKSACENSYTYNLAILAAGIWYVTGCRWVRGTTLTKEMEELK